MVLTTFWFLLIFNKSKVLASCSFPPQISHQNWYPKSTKIHNNNKSMIFGNRVLVLEVSQKPFFAFPCCMASTFFWSPCSVGMRFVTFATPPQRECDFFHFCRTSPARSSKIMKIASWSHAADVSARKMQKANRHQNRSFLWCLRSGRSFWPLQKFNEFMKNCAYSSRNIHNFTFGACMCSNKRKTIKSHNMSIIINNYNGFWNFMFLPNHLPKS